MARRDRSAQAVRKIAAATMATGVVIHAANAATAPARTARAREGAAISEAVRTMASVAQALESHRWSATRRSCSAVSKARKQKAVRKPARRLASREVSQKTQAVRRPMSIAKGMRAAHNFSPNRRRAAAWIKGVPGG